MLMIVNLPLRDSTRGAGLECFVKFIILKKKHQTIANDAINRIEQEEIVRYFSIVLENASRGKKDVCLVILLYAGNTS